MWYHDRGWRACTHECPLVVIKREYGGPGHKSVFSSSTKGKYKRYMCITNTAHNAAYVHHKHTQYVCITHTQYMCITNTHSMCASQTQHTAQCTTPEARGCKVFFAVTNKSYALVHMDRNCIALHADMNTLGIRYKQFVSHVPDAELARTVHCNFPPYSFYLFTVHWMCITCMTVMSPRILFLFTGCVLRI